MRCGRCGASQAQIGTPPCKADRPRFLSSGAAWQGGGGGPTATIANQLVSPICNAKLPGRRPEQLARLRLNRRNQRIARFEPEQSRADDPVDRKRPKPAFGVVQRQPSSLRQAA